MGGLLEMMEWILKEVNDNPSGYAVGFIDSGEWLEYTVTIEESREYTISARVASNNSNGVFRVKVDDKPVGADVS